MKELDWDDEEAEKGGYETFMLKEIYEQPEAVRETIGDRVRGHQLMLEALGLTEMEVRNLRRIVIVAAGTSYHAGVVGRYIIEEWARVPVEPDIASEWIYRNPVLSKDTLVIGISQSGESRDTVNAVRLARERGARTLAITNMMGTQITREVDATLYTRCGIEIGVAASKTFTAQVALLSLLALRLAEIRRTLPQEEIDFILDRLHELPEKMSEFLDGDHPIDSIAQRFYDRPFFLYLGRHIGLPVALEGALKLKEISYIPTDAYSAGEMKHGPDRDARRGNAGRRRRDEHPHVREDRLEHPGDARARRARDRDRDGRQRGHPAPRRRRDLRAAHAGVPAGRARRHPAAAARLPHRAPARAERRSAAQPGEDRHRRVNLGRVGAWLGNIGMLPAAEERAAARALEAAGYGTIWFGENPFNKEALSHAALLLDATERVTVATGIASIWLRSPESAANGAATLAEAHPGRFVLGLGVSHAPTVDAIGRHYAKPLTRMREYLDAMDARSLQGGTRRPSRRRAFSPRSRPRCSHSHETARRVRIRISSRRSTRSWHGRPSATGPCSRRSSRSCSSAIPSGRARLRATTSSSTSRSRTTATIGSAAASRRAISRTVAATGSSTALIAWGDEAAVLERVAQHIAAGADHVALQALGDDPVGQLTRLAPALL